MLDLNSTLSSSQVLHHGLNLNPLQSTIINLNAESCFPLQINCSDRDEVRRALSLHGTSNEISLAPKFMDMISTEHSASSVLTSKTPSDLGLLVDCEASSNHANQCNERSMYEHVYPNHSVEKHKSRAGYGDYILARDDQRPPNEKHSHKLHHVSDSRLSADDCKLSLEGESSSVVDGKALPLESTGSVISTNGMTDEKQFTSNLKDALYPYNNGVPSSRNIAEAAYGICKSSITSGGAAAHAYDSSVEEDAEAGGHMMTTRQLFPLKPCTEELPTSSVLNYGNTIKPIINTNFECGGATTSVSSNVLKTNLESVSASNFPVRPGPWSFPSSPHNIPLPSSTGQLLNPITHGIQPMKKSRRGPRSRSSQYRGVTFYRRTGRWESHIWDCGKQVYLGGFDTAHAAARAYDRAAIRFRGLGADINFNLGDYESEINQMNCVSKEEFVHLLRRQSMGFARGSSRFRGVTLHKCGRWEARMGQFLGKKAYDEAAIQSNGREAFTNFDTRLYNDLLKKPVSDVYEDDLELSLGTPLSRQRGLHTEEVRDMIAKHPPYSNSSPTLPAGSPMTGSLCSKQEGALNNMGQAWTGNRSFLDGSYNCPRQQSKHPLLDNQSLPQMETHMHTQGKIASDGSSHTYKGDLMSSNKSGLFTEASASFKLFTSATESSTEQQLSPITCSEPPPLPPPPLAAGGWPWHMQQNVRAATSLSSFSVPLHTSSPMQAAAASSGFSPQQQGFTFPQWLHKTGLSYTPTPSSNPSH